MGRHSPSISKTFGMYSSGTQIRNTQTPQKKRLRWWAALVPLDIDGAGRSRSLACRPAARGGYLEEFSSGPVLVSYNVGTPNLPSLADFF